MNIYMHLHTHACMPAANSAAPGRAAAGSAASGGSGLDLVRCWTPPLLPPAALPAAVLPAAFLLAAGMQAGRGVYIYTKINININI